MTPPQDLESWCTGCIDKWPLDTVRILCVAIDIGLARGYFCADDLPDRDYKQVNIIGATFRAFLRRIGFIKTGYHQSKRKSRKGGTQAVWTLSDPSKALAIKNQCREGLRLKEQEAANRVGVLEQVKMNI